MSSQFLASKANNESDEEDEDAPRLRLDSLESLKFFANLWIDDCFSQIVSEIDFESETKLLSLKGQILKTDLRPDRQEQLFEALSSQVNIERSDLIRLAKSLEFECFQQIGRELPRLQGQERELVEKWKSDVHLNRTVVYQHAQLDYESLTSNLTRLGKLVIVVGIHLNDEQIEILKRFLRAPQSAEFSGLEVHNKASLFLRSFQRELDSNNNNNVKTSSHFSHALFDPFKKIVYVSVEDVISAKTTELNLFKCSVTRLEPFTFDLLCKSRLSSVYANLRLLDLSFNKIKCIRSYTFSGLVNLQQINLSQNEIYSVESNAWSSLSSLKRLFLNNNQLTKLDVGLFEHLSDLVELNLANNRIEAIEQPFDGLKRLAYLTLKSNRLRGHLSMRAFGSLSGLVELDLSNNFYDAIDFACESSLANLAHLNLSSNQLAQIVQPSPPSCYDSLQKLNFSHNHLNLTQLESFASMFKSLKWLNVSHNGQENETRADSHSTMIRKHLNTIEYVIV